MLFVQLATASAAISATSRRRQKVATIAAVLTAAAPSEIALAVWYLSGELRQRRTGVGYAALTDLPAAAAEPSLTVAEVDATFEALAAVSGQGSRAERRRLLSELFGRATAPEQRMLAGLIGGELRQGASEGIMTDAVIAASALPAERVRHAVMLAGAISPVASAVLVDGADGLRRFGLRVGNAVRPMLASSAPDVATALAKLTGPASVEWKLDGIRIQVHKEDTRVRIFSRTLEEVTDRLPEIVQLVRSLRVHSVVLDGEALALRESGRPRPFQDTSSRVGSRVDVAAARVDLPLHAFFFDLLHLDGVDHISANGEQRWEALEQVVPAEARVPRIVTTSVDEASAFASDAVMRGHEGVVIKDPTAGYRAGRRGAAWIKVKPRHTLDLVVLAAEWGHGRRTGWLSNLHLGARNPEDGSYVMLGKTFKGLTDEILRWQTTRLLELEDHRDGWTVYVRPELVVEIAFDGVQRSSRYPGGMALRFARVLRYRDDKSAADADTVDSVRAVAATD